MHVEMLPPETNTCKWSRIFYKIFYAVLKTLDYIACGCPAFTDVEEYSKE